MTAIVETDYYNFQLSLLVYIKKFESLTQVSLCYFNWTRVCLKWNQYLRNLKRNELRRRRKTKVLWRKELWWWVRRLWFRSLPVFATEGRRLLELWWEIGRDLKMSWRNSNHFRHPWLFCWGASTRIDSRPRVSKDRCVSRTARSRPLWTLRFFRWLCSVSTRCLRSSTLWSLCNSRERPESSILFLEITYGVLLTWMNLKLAMVTCVMTIVPQDKIGRAMVVNRGLLPKKSGSFFDVIRL